MARHGLIVTDSQWVATGVSRTHRPEKLEHWDLWQLLRRRLRCCSATIVWTHAHARMRADHKERPERPPHWELGNDHADTAARWESQLTAAEAAVQARAEGAMAALHAVHRTAARVIRGTPPCPCHPPPRLTPAERRARGIERKRASATGAGAHTPAPCGKGWQCTKCGRRVARAQAL